jgi:hypothetical protein
MQVYLPMHPFQNLRERQQAIEAEKLKTFTEANEIFKTRPGYHSGFSNLMKRTDELIAASHLPQPALPSDERIEFALKLLDLRMKFFFNLVTDIQTQETFVAVSGAFERQAWEDYRGIASIEPLHGNPVLAKIRTRLRHWIRKSHEKLARPSKTERSKHKPKASVRPAVDSNRELCERLDRALVFLQIGHEELAHRMKIGKTTYYSVRNGKGKTTTRIAVREFMVGIEREMEQARTTPNVSEQKRTVPIRSTRTKRN